MSLHRARPLLPAVVALVAAVLALACDGNGGVRVVGSGFTITCTVGASSVPAGSSAPVAVAALVTRDGLPVPGVSVAFTSTLGDVDPDVVITGSDGRAAASFAVPDLAGTAVVTARIVDGAASEQLTTTCIIEVTGAGDPRLTVSLVSPAQLAGLSLTIGFDPTVLVLPPGGAQPLGSLDDEDCFSQVNSTTPGEVILELACPTFRTVGGTDVARFSFQHVGNAPAQTLADFSIECRGVNEAGQQVVTLCQTVVEQL